MKRITLVTAFVRIYAIWIERVINIKIQRRPIQHKQRSSSLPQINSFFLILVGVSPLHTSFSRDPYTYNYNVVVKGKLTNKISGINFNLTNYDSFRVARISDVNISARCCRLAEKSPFLVCSKTDVIGTKIIVCSPISSWISLKSKQNLMSIS